MTQTCARPAFVVADPRLDLLHDWLGSLPAALGLAPATLTPASSDAGFRRYFRVAASSAGERGTLIAMDAPPPEKCREFAAIAALLHGTGLHAPHVLAQDFERGFMLLTDLGTSAYIDVLNDANARALMRDALDALIRWQSVSRPGVLPVFDETFMRREMELMPQWYVERHLGLALTDRQRATLDTTFAALVRSALAQPQVFMLRDFMPRNLMVAEPNPGILDFQDAVHGPLTYDVASLLRDAFISWDESFELDCFAWYWEQARKAGLPVDADFGEFYRQLEWMGLQRHIKIIGLFARLHYRDGKPRYLTDVPRFIGYARKVARRYRELTPFAVLLDELEGCAVQVGYTF
ncbi:phosphotransferase [Mycetohabitans sp. B8]|uniref:aminoglycoside phosphotransferase family protein n=1 Tax=Mycetohabitans sp. B8 TaxID=2841845 RepID=UPI001F40638A|nr:phosphotransferase [Mycetohabitans sp. B8]MCG1043273.1 phosphotransferase [Mycetohabitans sp. B8]